MQLTFDITLQNPPANLTYGLQKGSGSNYEVVQVQRSTGNDLHFSFTAEVKGNELANVTPDFKEPFVQGPATGRFVYLGIGSYAGHEDLCNGRIKIPLSGINWDTIEKSQWILQTTVPGTGKNGGAAYATVKPFKGWEVG